MQPWLLVSVNVSSAPVLRGPKELGAKIKDSIGNRDIFNTYDQYFSNLKTS